MIQYLRADLWRLGKRIPRWIVWILALIIGAADIFIASKKAGFNYVELGNSMVTVLRFLPVLLAMFNLYFVYEDDMQTKTMQAAIGRGIGRFLIIFSKWLQMVILSVVDCVSLLLVMSLVGLQRGFVLRNHSVRLVGAQTVCVLLTIAVMTALVMIIIFSTMHVGITQILFLVLCIKPVTMLLSSLELRYEVMARLQPTKLMPGKNLDGIRQMIIAGTFNIANIVAIIIYVALGMMITYMIFNKKELDF